MSIQFSDTSTYKGLVQLYEKELKLGRAAVSGDTTALKEFTADVNLALDDFVDLAINSAGLWQWDDSNHTDYPIITTNLVSGQRDYPFTSDENGNLILDIYRVMVADSSGIFREVKPKDQFLPNSDNNNTDSYIDGLNTTGSPATYDKTGNAIFLDPIPNYSRANSLKVFINREGSYFTSTDTTKKPGIPGLFHKYLYLKPAREYARRFTLVNFGALDAEVTKLEEAIKNYFSLREKDVPRRMRPNVESCK